MHTAQPVRTSRTRGAPLVLFVATRAELTPLVSTVQSAGLPVSRSDAVVRIGGEGRDLLVIRTGVGPDRAEAEARRLFAETAASAALSLGVAGGLSPELQAGDLVVGDRVILRQSSGLQSFSCDAGIRDAAMTALHRRSGRHRLGPILTVDRILTAGEKRVLATELGALAVDMESGAIASAASACSIPFLAIRGVLDPVHEELAIDFDQFLDAEGEPDLPRLLRYLLIHPSSFPHLVGLGRRTKTVCTDLGRLLLELAITLS